MLRDESGMLDMWQMPALLDSDEPRGRQTVLPQHPIFGRHDLIVIAPYDERRQLDSVEPFFEIGVVPARLPSEFCNDKSILQYGVHLRFARRHREDLVSNRLVVIEIAQRLFWPPDEVVAARHTFHADTGGRELYETAEMRAVADQDLGGEPPSKRVTD